MTKSPESGFLYLCILAEKNGQIRNRHPQNFEPFVGRLMGYFATKNKKSFAINGIFLYLAEAVRFELTEGVNPRRFSRPVH